MNMATHCIISQLNLSKLHHMNNRFAHYDSTGDGRLGYLEMRQVLEDVGVSNQQDVELIIEALDSNRSGMVEYSEFVAGCLDISSKDLRDHLRIMCNVFDLDGSGTISFLELRQVLTTGPNAVLLPRETTRCGSLKIPSAATILPDGKSVEDVMKEVDRNKDNTVQYAELEEYLLAEHECTGKQIHNEQLNVKR